MNRIVGLDCLRIYSVIIVFLFHSWMHLECTFGKLTTFISEGAVYMTVFFMLSGYVLGMKYKNLSINSSSLIKFYKKRAISIYPFYILCVILYPILLGNETLVQNIMLLPIEILGLQSFFPTLNTITHNGGTWFVSCIIFCYIFSPLCIVIINGISRKVGAYLYILLWGILLLLPWSIYVFHGNEIYTNPLIRLIEFTLGMILALNVEIIVKRFYWITNKISIISSYVFVIIIVMLLIKWHIPHISYMSYSAMLVPFFSWQLLAHTTQKYVMKKVLKYCADISYSFFLMQLFAFKFTDVIVDYFNITSSIYALLIAFFICFFFSILGHKIIEQPIAIRLKRE